MSLKKWKKILKRHNKKLKNKFHFSGVISLKISSNLIGIMLGLNSLRMYMLVILIICLSYLLFKISSMNLKINYKERKLWNNVWN